MATQSIKVGDKIRVFEILKDVYIENVKGIQTCEKKDKHFGDKFGCSLYVGSEFDFFVLFKGDAKLIGQLVIKSIKSAPCTCTQNESCSLCRTELEEHQYWFDKFEDLIAEADDER